MNNTVKMGCGLPVINEQLLMFFVTHCAQILCLTHATIMLYLYGIRNLYIESNCSDPLCSLAGTPLPLLELILKGIKKLAPLSTRKRYPITRDVLQLMCNQLEQQCFGIYTDSMLKAFFTMSFFGFFRSGELVCQTNSFDPKNHLTVGDVSVQNYMSEVCICVHLKCSKGDPLRQGVDVYLFKTDVQSLCPVTAVLSFVTMRRSRGAVPTDPFYEMEDNLPLTRTKLVALMHTVMERAGVNPSGYSGHSFRKGAATSSHVKKLDDSVIRFLGRWKSDCHMRYITPNKSIIRDAQRSLAM